MSTDIELQTVNLDTEAIGNIEVSKNLYEPCVSDTKDLEVSINKKEYSIVGDGLYASVSAEEAPQWLLNVVDSVVTSSLGNSLIDVVDLKNSVLSALDQIDIAKNQYEELINIDATIEGVIASRLATLNATVAANNASIVDLDTTKVTADEALAIATDHLTSEINDGAVNSAILNMQSTLATPIAANATSIDTLTSAITDPNTGLSATASATKNLQTYVGIDAAGASSGTGLSAYLEGSDGEIGTAGSQLLNDIEVGAAVVESKFAYNSNLNINGNYYNSGFGLNSSLINPDSGIPVGDSEFWINADKFRFTNTGQTGTATPFTIDASGATPQITFNGIVDFTNTNTSGTTTIDGSKVTTGSLDAAAITTGTLKASQLVASNDGSTTWSGGGLVSNNFNGNPYGDIGNPTLGFRLSSDAIGSAEDPNIYGAYMKGSFIEGGEVNGAIIRGSSIVFNKQLRATAAGEPFYSYGIPADNSTTSNLVKYNYSNDVATTSVFGFYAYNALPNGLDEPDHFMTSTATISVGVSSYNSNAWVGGCSSFKADVYTSGGTLLGTLCNVPLTQGFGYTSVTSNGITVTRNCVEDLGDYGRDTLSLNVSGAANISFTGYDNQKLKVVFTVGNWGAGSVGTTSITTSASANTG